MTNGDHYFIKEIILFTSTYLKVDYHEQKDNIFGLLN